MKVWERNTYFSNCRYEFAERVGFEPTVPLTQDTGFRDRPIQPL